MLIGAIICFVVGSLFTGLGVMLRRGGAEPREQAAGVITYIRHASQREYGQVGYPHVKFTTAAGQVVEAEASTIAAEDDGEAIGAEVSVRYDPANPEQFEIAGQGSRAAGTAFLGLGVLCDVLGVLFLVLFAL